MASVTEKARRNTFSKIEEKKNVELKGRREFICQMTLENLVERAVKYNKRVRSLIHFLSFSLKRLHHHGGDVEM